MTILSATQEVSDDIIRFEQTSMITEILREERCWRILSDMNVDIKGDEAWGGLGAEFGIWNQSDDDADSGGASSHIRQTTQV